MFTRSALEALSKDEIIHLFLRYSESMEKRVAALEKEIAGLKKRDGRGVGGKFEIKPSKKGRSRKPGQKQGHEAASRPTPSNDEIDETLKTNLDGCPHCDGHVENKKTVVRYVEEIIPARTLLRKHVDESGYCPTCKKWVQSRHRDEISSACGSAGVGLGPRALALAAFMKNDLRVSFRKISEYYNAHFGLEVTHSALALGMNRLGRHLYPIYEIILERLRASEAANADETGWRVANRNAWLWVATNPDYAAFKISYSRGGKVIKELLEGFEGTLGSDCFSAYNTLPYDQQKCLVHILRELAETAKTTEAEEYTRFHKIVKRILKDALRLKARKSRRGYGVKRYERKARQIEKRMQHILTCVWLNKEVRRITKTLTRHQASLFRFLHEDKVEAHNNSAERALRPRVILRKTCGGNRSERGARAVEVIVTVLETFRKNGLNFVETVAEFLRRQSNGTGREYISALLPAPSS